VNVPAGGPPWGDDGETTTPAGRCLVCSTAFVPTGRQLYCRAACRKAAYRRRHGRCLPVVAVSAGRSRRDRTVYQCPQCEELQIGVQRCPDCGIFGRSRGLGGACPHCDQVVTLDELDLDPTR